MREQYLPRFAVGDYVALEVLKQVIVVKIVDIRPRFNEVFGIPTYYLSPPLGSGHSEEIMAPVLDSSFRRATKEEILLFYKGEYDHGQGD